jgi:hypothetical protein
MFGKLSASGFLTRLLRMEKNRAEDKNNVLKPFLNLKDVPLESARSYFDKLSTNGDRWCRCIPANQHERK